MEQFEALEMAYHLPAGQDTNVIYSLSLELAANAIGHAIEETLDGIYKRDKKSNTCVLAQQVCSLDELIYREIKNIGEKPTKPVSLAAKALATEIECHLRKYYFN